LDVVSKHFKYALDAGELDEGINVQNLHINQKGRSQALYDLDAVISVGYRVKSLRGTQFRRWATKVVVIKMSTSPDFILNTLPANP